MPLKFLNSFTRWTAAVAVAAFTSVAVQAASITITNPSFESPVLTLGGFTVVAPPGWIGAGGGSRGVFRPSPGSLPAPPLGTQVGYLNFGGVTQLSQSLADVLTASTTYTLQADFAYRKDCCGTPNFSLDLLAGTTVIGTATGGSPSFDSLAFHTATVTFTALASNPLLGSALGIRISNLQNLSNAQVDFDNVRLDASPAAVVPVPAAAWLLASAFGGLAGFGRRRKPS